MEDLKQCISALRQEIAQELATFSGTLAEEVRILASLRAPAAAERGDLERLGKIDAAASALEQLEREYGRRKQELEAEIAAGRAAWAEEQARAERDRKERDEAVKRQRQYEAEEYEHKRNLQREALERAWQQREAELKNREDQLERARLESAARMEQEIAAIRKEAETERRVSELRIKSLEETVARQQAELQARGAPGREAASGLDIHALTETISKRIMASVQGPLDELRSRISSIERHAADSQRGSQPLESAISMLRRQFEELHANMAADLFEFETNMKAQAAMVESTRTAMAQTDELVERVVEALETMQSAVLGHSEDRAATVH